MKTHGLESNKNISSSKIKSNLSMIALVMLKMEENHKVLTIVPSVKTTLLEDK